MIRPGLVLASILLAGCNAPGAAPSAPEDMAMMARSDLAPDGIMDLEGRIVGLDRAGLAGVNVSLCQETCRDTTTGAQGEFSFPATPIAFYTLRARKPGAADYAALDFPLYLVRGANPRLLPLVLPRVATQRPITPDVQTLAVDGALSLTLDGRALSLQQGGAVAALGGVRIPSDLFPNFCVPSARVLAMWAFAPTYVQSRRPVGVQLTDVLGLAPGATVDFIDIDPAEGRPLIVASGTVAQDGKTIATSQGLGPNRLGWLLAAVVSGGP